MTQGTYSDWSATVLIFLLSPYQFTPFDHWTPYQITQFRLFIVRTQPYSGALVP